VGVHGKHEKNLENIVTKPSLISLSIFTDSMGEFSPSLHAL